MAQTEAEKIAEYRALMEQRGLGPAEGMSMNPRAPVGPPAPTPLIDKALLASGREPAPTVADPGTPLGPDFSGMPAPIPPRPSLPTKEPAAPVGPPQTTLEDRLLALNGPAAAPAASPKQGLEDIQAQVKALGSGSRGAQAKPAEGTTAMLEAAGAQQEASTKMAQARTEIDQMAQRNIEEERRKSQEKQSQLETSVYLKQKEIDDAAQKILATQPKMKNPYKDDGPGKGVALVLLGAIAGAASGFRGKENQTLEIINGNIARDYQAQQDALANRKGNLSTMQAMHRDLKNEVKDEKDRFAVYKAAALQDAQYRMVRAADLAPNDQVRAEYLRQIGLIKHQADVDAATNADRARSFTLQRLGLEATIAANLQKGTDPNKEKMAAAQVPGLVYEGSAPPNEAQTKLVRDKLVQHQNVDRTIQQAIALRSKYGSEVFNRAAVGKGKKLARELSLALAGFNDFGNRLTPEKLKLLNVPDDLLEMSGNAIGGNDRVLNSLKRMQEENQVKMDNILKANNYSRALQQDAGNL